MQSFMLSSKSAQFLEYGWTLEPVLGRRQWTFRWAKAFR